MPELEKTEFLDWKNCLRLSNNDAELIISIEVGPRIISYRTADGKNFFKVFEEQLKANASGAWQNYGGHRLWHAPEEYPRTYFPDNAPVEYDWNGRILTLRCEEESTTRLQKVITVELAESGTEVKLCHRIYNRNPWAVTFAPWCLSVMAENGRVVIPQEPFVPHGEKSGESFESARPLVLWQFTRMDDPRFTWGGRYIQMREDNRYDSKQKFGVANKQGWAAYALNGQLFLKKHDYDPNAVYPDSGCNAEFFTMPGFLEIESLVALAAVNPDDYAQLNESRSICNIDLSEDENEIEKQIEGVI